MKGASLITLCAALVNGLAAHARETESCNAHVLNSVIIDATTFEAQSALVAAARSGSSDLFFHLWTPLQWAYYGLFTPHVVLYYRESEDLDEIATSISQSPVLQGLVVKASPNGTLCSLAPPRILHDVHELHNEITNHYFLASNEEKLSIERGSAGPGWKTTGVVLKVDDLQYPDCHPRSRVYRFYTSGANSHFFTSEPQECGGLRKAGTGWLFEGVAFAATRPSAGQCWGKTPTPVYRFYNTRWMHGDSNHRYVIAADIRREMVGKGWTEEGVVFCLPPQV